MRGRYLTSRDLTQSSAPPPIDERVHRRGPQTGGAVDGERPAVDSRSQVLSPAPGRPIRICGDSLPTNLGRAAGAIEAAEAVLQEAYGLSAPV